MDATTRLHRCIRHALSLAASAALAFAPGLQLHAATLSWSGLGAAPVWSDAANWLPVRGPLDGDDLLFNGSSPFNTSSLDVSRSFSALSFGTGAGAFALHVQGDGTVVLTFTGAGVRNLTGGSGPIRQTMFADAGTTGGTILFTGNAGLNVGADPGFRPLDLIARGGSTAGSRGGHLVFEGRAATSASTFDGLRAEGGSVAGAGGGEIVFRNDAVATTSSTITLFGGTAAGALGASASFADRASSAGNLNVLAGSSGGLGGRLDFSGLALAQGGIDTAGAAFAFAGAEGLTTFRGDARLTGGANNRDGGSAGAGGGRLEFSERANIDASAITPGSGTLIVRNSGASVAGAGGGSTVFRDDAFVRGTEVVIDNATGEGAAAGTNGGSSTFFGRSHAGGAAIRNAGASDSGAVGGVTRFFDQSSAEQARLTMRGGTGAAAVGGAVSFNDDATAASAQLQVEGGSAAGALGGSARFTGRSTAAGAAIVNGGGQAAGALGGATLFEGTANAGVATIVNAASGINGASGGVTTFSAGSGAGQAHISNESTSSASGGGRGTTFFKDTSSAQTATIDNQGGIQAINAFTNFSQSATAGNAAITNAGGRAAGAGGGSTQFVDRSTAGSATLVMAGGDVAGAGGGVATFFADASAGIAVLDVRGAAVTGATGGAVRFANQATAGRSTVSVQGSQASSSTGPEGGLVSFTSSSSADHATFTIGGNLNALGRWGRVEFLEGATAADASFTTLAGFDNGGRLIFEGSALNLASAARATIVNGSRAPGSVSTGGDFGGGTIFQARSSADHATITNAAGATAFGAQTVFNADSTAADAVIDNAGGRAGDRGGITFFRDTSSAGRSTIVNRGGAVNASGITTFDGTATAAQASLTAEGASQGGDIGGRLIFGGRSSAGQSTLVAGGGSAGGLGGRIDFQNQADGRTARVVLNGGSAAAAGGTLDIGGVAVSLQVGSIEGGGNIALGVKSLVVVGNGRATTFSGVIDGSTPAVFPSLSVLGGSTTLTGANTYTGRTSIGDGVNANSGKLVVANTTGSATGSGEVRIQRGGTLAGSGFIAGPVTLLSGGTIAPGDPVTLTLRDSLTWDGGGVIRLVLGADNAGSDQLVVHSLLRGTDGPFVFDLVDAGFVVGTAYELIRFDSVAGFSASDFTFAGSVRPGQFTLSDGAIGFTAAAVPEPGAVPLFALGLFVLGWRARRSFGVRACTRRFVQRANDRASSRR
jgi:hypothetical protein